MAQKRSFFDDVKKELECSVCQEHYSETNEPKILKCLHSFCKSCLEAWLRQQGGGALSCPTCRQVTDCSSNDINSLPSNLFYKQMVDIVKAYSEQGQEDTPQCGSCDERKSLKFYCADCNHFLCEECSEAHKRMKALRSHHVKEIGKFRTSDAQDYARRANVCKKHNDEVRFYCEQCVICICRDCAILDHRDHNIISLDNGLQKKKSEIEKKMKQVQENVPRLRNEKESLEKRRTKINKSIEQATEELHKTAEQNIQLIRQHQSSVTERLMEQKETLETAFSNTMTGLDEKLVKIKSSLDFGNEILQRNNLPEILNVEEVLEQRFQELMEPCAFDLKVDYSAVKYVSNDLSSLKDSPGKLVTSNTEPSLTMTDGRDLTEVVKGEDCTFTVITKDSQGNKTYSEIDGVEVAIRSLQTRKSVKVTITDSQDGCYRVSYKPEVAGEFKVLITVAGEAIKGSPFQLKVEERKGKRESRCDWLESPVAARVSGRPNHRFKNCPLDASSDTRPGEEGTTLENGSGPRQYNNSNAPSNRFENRQFNQHNKRNRADVSEPLGAFKCASPEAVSSASSGPEQCTVEVHGLPDGASEDLVVNYFENARRSKGGPVSCVVMQTDFQKCLVTFESAEDAMRTVEHSPHTLSGAIMHVSLLQEFEDENSDDFDEKPVGEDGSTEENDIIITVSDILPSTSEDAVVNYFENSRRSGGGEISDFHYTDGGEAIISFVEVKVSEPLMKMQTTHPTSEPKCSMCMNMNKDPVYPNNCGHWFCKSCKKHFIEKAMMCPVCKIEYC